MRRRLRPAAPQPAVAALAACCGCLAALFRRVRAQLPASEVELQLPLKGSASGPDYGATGTGYGAGGDERRRPAPAREGIGAADVQLSVANDHEYGWRAPHS